MRGSLSFCLLTLMLAGWPALSPQDPLSALTAEDAARGGRLHSFRKLELRDLRREPGVSTMPGYGTKLTAPEIEDLVAYLATLRGQK